MTKNRGEEEEEAGRRAQQIKGQPSDRHLLARLPESHAHDLSSDGMENYRSAKAFCLEKEEDEAE